MLTNTALKNSVLTTGFYFDMTKAFDFVSNARLYSKFKFYSIRDTLPLLHSYVKGSRGR